LGAQPGSKQPETSIEMSKWLQVGCHFLAGLFLLLRLLGLCCFDGGIGDGDDEEEEEEGGGEARMVCCCAAASSFLINSTGLVALNWKGSKGRRQTRTQTNKATKKGCTLLRSPFAED